MSQLDNQLLDAVKAYKMPDAAIELLTKHRPLIIAGTTAAGKETVVDVIHNAGNGTKVVTHTTRSPREGEENGKDYWFVSEARMLELIDEESFIEVKELHSQQISGSSLASYQTIVDQGQKPILVIDVQGIEEITKFVFGLQPIFMLPPSFDVWMERLEGRGTMSHVERVRRLKSAEQELERALRDDKFILVINKDIQQAAKEVVDGATDAFTQRHNRELAQKLIDHARAVPF